MAIGTPVFGAVALTGSNGTTSLVVTRPTVINGDVMLLFMDQANASEQTFTPPSGWTLLANVFDSGTTTGIKISIWYKIVTASGSEPTTYTVTTTGTAARTKAVIGKWTGVANPTVMESGEFATAGKATSVAALAVGPITAEGGERGVVVFGDASLSTTTIDAGTEMVEDANGSNTAISIYDLGLLSAGSVTRTVTSSNTINTGAAIMVLLAPAASGPTLNYDDHGVAGGSYAIDMRASVPGNAGTLTYTHTPDNALTTVVDGVLFIDPDPTNDITYTFGVSESPGGLTDTATLLVAAEAPPATVIVNVRDPRKPGDADWP